MSRWTLGAFLIGLFVALAGGAYTAAPSLVTIVSGSAAVGPINPLVVTGNSNIPTYSAAATFNNSAAGDLYCVAGSATKVVKIKGVRVSAVATSAIVVDVSLILRSSASTGGGAASVALVAMDQLNAAATGSVTRFTSAPTPGTAIGAIRSRKIAASTQGNSATTSEGLFQFSVYWDQPVTLRGTSQFLCVNTTAVGGGGSWDIDHEQTEE